MDSWTTEPPCLADEFNALPEELAAGRAGLACPGLPASGQRVCSNLQGNTIPRDGPGFLQQDGAVLRPAAGSTVCVAAGAVRPAGA